MKPNTQRSLHSIICWVSCLNPSYRTQIFGNSIQFNITLSMQYLYPINVPPFYFASMSYTIIPVSAIPGSFSSALFNLCSLCQAFRQGMMKTLTSAIPPIEGIAIGLATSAPAPVNHNTLKSNWGRLSVATL